MQIGLHFPSSTIGPDPGAIRDFAQTAEGLGYDHLATFEHVVAAPPVNEPGHPQHQADTPYHEAFVLFGFLAACTSRIGLSTSIVVLPQRQAVLPEVEQRAQLAQGAVDGQRLCRLGRTQPRA